MNKKITRSYSELVEAVLEEQPGAFEELIQKSHRLVRKIALPIVPSWAVDDAVQETYLLVYRKLHLLKDRNSFTSWASRIALNVCYQWQRKKQDTVELLPEHATESVDSTRVDVRRALAQLPKIEREVLILREFIGLSYEEIGRVVNAPLGTVKSRLSKARSRMRSLLEGSEEIVSRKHWATES